MSPELSTIHPTGNLLLVHLRPGVQQTASGIIIPANAQQITQWGDILATGPEAAAICSPGQLVLVGAANGGGFGPGEDKLAGAANGGGSPGQLVLVGLHAGTHVTWHQNTPVILVSLDDCLALLEPGEQPPTE